jgi:uncharacterized protein YndB with AHSA1/START domain
MATNVASFATSPERVFAVLSDPKTYAYWVVGSKEIRGADPEWPAVGAKLHHTVGAGPFTLNDNTEVLESQPPRRLVLQARTRPFGTARVVLELDADEDGCLVTMQEGPGDRLSKLVHNPLADWLLRRRNNESLRRLGELAGSGNDAPHAAVSGATPR